MFRPARPPLAAAQRRGDLAGVYGGGALPSEPWAPWGPADGGAHRWGQGRSVSRVEGKEGFKASAVRPCGDPFGNPLCCSKATEVSTLPWTLVRKGPVWPSRNVALFGL